MFFESFSLFIKNFARVGRLTSDVLFSVVVLGHPVEIMPHRSSGCRTVLLDGATERANGSFVTEEKPSDELMSDMLPVDKRRPVDDGPDAGGDDDDNVPDNQNGNSSNEVFSVECR